MQRQLVLAAILAFAGVAMAQVHGPGASVTSFHSGPTFSQVPGVAASVTSIGPNGFGCCGGGMAVGGGFGFGHNPRVFVGVGPVVRPRVVAVPVYVPSYYYPWTPTVYPPYPVATYPAYPATYDNGSPYTIEQGTAAAVDRSTVSAAPSNDARYGEHYLDAREQELENRVRDLERQVRSQSADSNVQVTPAPREAAPAPREQAAARPPMSAPRESLDTATLLVLKNGERLEVHNYAIVGDTVWVLSDKAARKVPLSDLDLNATTKENDARGITFKLPHK
jgi:hypothetical protein